jgi:hypothetical protein
MSPVASFDSSDATDGVTVRLSAGGAEAPGIGSQTLRALKLEFPFFFIMHSHFGSAAVARFVRSCLCLFAYSSFVHFFSFFFWQLLLLVVIGVCSPAAPRSLGNQLCAAHHRRSAAAQCQG